MNPRARPTGTPKPRGYAGSCLLEPPPPPPPDPDKSTFLDSLELCPFRRGGGHLAQLGLGQDTAGLVVKPGDRVARGIRGGGAGTEWVGTARRTVAAVDGAGGAVVLDAGAAAAAFTNAEAARPGGGKRACSEMNKNEKGRT